MGFKEEKVLAKVVLFGFMGAGKSEVGKILSQKLDIPFIDTDAMIAEKYGSIDKIFQTKGERFFRKIEEETILSVLNKTGDSVISPGGGAVLSASVQEEIFKYAVPIYLKCSIRIAFERVKGSKRPLAKSFDQFKTLFNKRRQVYESFPFYVDTSKKLPLECAEKIADFLKVRQISQFQKIIIAPAGLQRVSREISEFFITDSNLFNLHPFLFRGRKGIVLLAGEKSKSLQSVNKIYEKLLEYGITRNSTISYVGGGVIGDTAGFAASTLLRGISLRAFPTTLLSFVDSALGGKNGVNLPIGKNLVGTFYIPESTFVNPLFLSTLPETEVLNGSGEIFKYALLSENGLFEMLESSKETIFKSLLVKEILVKSILEKFSFVQEDLFDKRGIRAFLNLGHTVGHAVESISNFSIKHGEGVAFGIIISAFFAKRNGILPKKDFERICILFDKMGFTFPDAKFSKEQILNKVIYDKKRNGSKILWILPERYNSCVAKEVYPEEIADTFMEVINENPCN